MLFNKIKTAAGFYDQEDEFLYGFIASELENGLTLSGLWTKALSETEFDESKAKAFYIRKRYEQVKPYVKDIEKCLALSQSLDLIIESKSHEDSIEFDIKNTKKQLGDFEREVEEIKSQAEDMSELSIFGLKKRLGLFRVPLIIIFITSSLVFFTSQWVLATAAGWVLATAAGLIIYFIIFEVLIFDQIIDTAKKNFFRIEIEENEIASLEKKITDLTENLKNIEGEKIFYNNEVWSLQYEIKVLEEKLSPLFNYKLSDKWSLYIYS
jgi:hypothetical protein